MQKSFPFTQPTTRPTIPRYWLRAKWLKTGNGHYPATSDFRSPCTIPTNPSFRSLLSGPAHMYTTTFTSISRFCFPCSCSTQPDTNALAMSCFRNATTNARGILSTGYWRDRERNSSHRAAYNWEREKSVYSLRSKRFTSIVSHPSTNIFLPAWSTLFCSSVIPCKDGLKYYKVCSKSSQTFSEKRQQIIIFAKFIYWLQNSPLPSQYRV